MNSKKSSVDTSNLDKYFEEHIIHCLEEFKKYNYRIPVGFASKKEWNETIDKIIEGLRTNPVLDNKKWQAYVVSAFGEDSVIETDKKKKESEEEEERLRKKKKESLFLFTKHFKELWY